MSTPVRVSANRSAFVSVTPPAELVSSPWSSVTVPFATSAPPAMFSEAEPPACRISCGVTLSPNAGTPSLCAAVSAPSACQSSFGSVVAAPAAVVTRLIASEPPETPSWRNESNPTRSAPTPVASKPR